MRFLPSKTAILLWARTSAAAGAAGRRLGGWRGRRRAYSPVPPTLLEAASAEAALHRKRLFLTLAIAGAIFALERFTPPGLWRPWTTLALAAVALALGGEVIQNSLHTLSRARLNGDSVVALGALGAFLGGIAASALMTLGRLSPVALGPRFTGPAFPGPGAEGGAGIASLGLDAAALLLALPHLGRLLEARGKARAARAILELRALRPARARVLDGKGEIEAPVERVRDGHRVAVGPAERIPVDGVIVEGSGNIDESILGVEEPVVKGPDERVYAGTLNGEAPLVVRARGPAADCAWHQALGLALQAQGTPAPRSAAEVWATSALSALGVTVAAILGTALWSEGWGYGPAAHAALGALAAAWPGPLVLASQAAAQAGIAGAIRRGGVARSMAALVRLARTEVAFFAKTGTLTRGRPRVVEVVPLHKETLPDEVLFLAMVLEIRSEHPIAEGIRHAAGSYRRTVRELRGFRAVPQKGLRGQYQGKELLFGSLQLLTDAGVPVGPARATHASMAALGLTPLALAWGENVLGMVGMADEERPGAAEAAQAMRRMGIRCALLSGDCRATVETIGKRLGMDEVHGELSLPSRAEAVRARAADGSVALAVGHGIVDATVLAAAKVSIALQGADDLAIDSASALVLGSDPRGAARLVRKAREMARRARGVLAAVLPISFLTLAAAAVSTAYGRPLAPLWSALLAGLSTSAAAVLAGRSRRDRQRAGM